MTWLTLATEDELSEQIGLRLAQEVRVDVEQCLRRQGFGYLKKRLSNFCQMAQQRPVLLITDLDNAQCPSQLVGRWLGKRPQPAGLLIRVAVREIESWLLADHVAMRRLLGNAVVELPGAPDTLPDPKRELLRLSHYAPRDVRADLLAPQGSVASQGLGYNARLGELVRRTWEPERAANRSPSLGRALVRLRELSERIHRN